MEDSAVLYCLLILLVLVLTLYDFHKKKNFVKTSVKNIPVVPFLPWIGSIYLFIKELRYPYLAYETAKSIVNADYCLVFYWYMPTYITANPDDVQVLLPNAIDRGTFTKIVLKDMLENCLINEEISQWKINRKIMNKSFKQQSLNAMMMSINEAVSEYLPKLENTMRGLEIIETNKRFFMETFLKQYFPYFQKNKHEVDVMYETLKLINDSACTRALRPWLFIRFFFNMTKMKKTLDGLLEQTNQMAFKVIVDLRKGLEDGTISEETDDVIINLERGGIDPHIIASEIKFLVGAASDTQGFAFCMVIIALGIYPEIQEKVFNEVLEVVGPTDYVSQHHIKDLKYTDMVIKETLRLFPPVPLMPRKTIDVVNLGNGKMLPKDMEIFISVYNLHRNEKHWKNPLEFDPNRFLPEEVEKRHPFAFVPFSSGSRNCIGHKYAMLTQFVAVAHLVRKYKIGCTSLKSILDIELKPFITLEMVDENVACTFTPRQNNVEE